MKRYVSIITFSLLIASQLAQATLSIQATPRQIHPGESLTLTLSSDQSQQATPNLAPLEQNFEVLSTSHQINYSQINGQSTLTNEWTFILYPKKTGVLTIPPLSVGSEHTTETIQIEVSHSARPAETQHSSTEPSGMPQQDLFIETKATPLHSYVNQQIMYTVRVYNRRNFINIEYTPPRADNALLMQLKQGRRYQAFVQDQPYTVEEISYAIFPTKSGPLTIHPPHLKGMFYDTLPQPVQVKGKSIQLQVRPAKGNTPFLPAQLIQLSEQFEPDTTQIEQGGTLIRHIQIKGIGVLASLLPIPASKGKDYAVYPSQPKLSNHESVKGIVGKASFSLTYLFDKPGQHVLPAIEIPWFNVLTRQVETARLPSVTIEVLAASAGTGSTSTPSASPMNQPHEVKQATQSNLWMISTFALLLLLLLLLLLFLKNQLRGYFQRKRKSTPSAKHPQTNWLRQLKRACQQQDPKATQQALLKWAQLTWPSKSISHLHQINEQQTDLAFTQAILHLIEVLYQPKQSPAWQGKPFWDAFQSYVRQHQPKKQKRQKKKKVGLPGLNPS